MERSRSHAAKSSPVGVSGEPEPNKAKPESIERMRRAIAKKGDSAKASSVVKMAKIQKAEGLAALGELVDLGEFREFRRKKRGQPKQDTDPQPPADGK